MNKVHILSPDIIAKIAAGEVVERPASVLKELMENALDADTQSIDVHLKQAGKIYLSIKDSGTGISEEDIEKIFQRHSTSKISSPEDLFRIHSLGFRGEALYSIAAVSDIVLRSRPQDQEAGWEIHLRGGEKLGLKPAAMPVGTEIEVQELFFNTPARRKFLKSNTTELNQILNIFIPYTLLYPHIRFVLTHGEKPLLDLAPGNQLRARIAEALNLNEEHLLELSHTFEQEAITVRAVLGDINIHRSRRDMQFLFINNRPVFSKVLSFHLNQVYRLILPDGSFPFFALYIDMPAEDVDVNIHPTKREVKIRDEQSLATLLRHMCENALLSGGSAKQAVARDEGPSSSRPSFVQQALSGTAQQAGEETRMSFVQQGEEKAVKHFRLSPTEQYSFPEKKHPGLQGEPLLFKKQDNLPSRLGRARFVGTFINKFLFFEEDRSLLVIDQHAAQERITFEQLVQQMEKGQIEVQNLLSPYLLELSPQDMLSWEEAQPALDQIGFSSTQFDEQTVAIHSYPVLIKDPAKAVCDLLAGGDFARCDHETMARRACRSSIMAGDKLNPEQCEFLRRQLLKCRDPFTCPHGRPTVMELKEDFLDKQFLRT